MREASITQPQSHLYCYSSGEYLINVMFSQTSKNTPMKCIGVFYYFISAISMFLNERQVEVVHYRADRDINLIHVVV